MQWSPCIQMPLIIIKGKVRNLTKIVVLKYQVTQIFISLWAMEFPLLLLSTSAYLFPFLIGQIQNHSPLLIGHYSILLTQQSNPI